MRMVDLIEKKKQGSELARKEIKFIIDGFVSGEVRDYQMSAFAMAVYFKGMTYRETADLTLAMMNSGEVFDLKAIKGIKVDKHSTGGIGDKTSIAVGPIIAALGVPFAKMSGRGLGFTGGTLDKLESISGFNVSATQSEFISLVNKNGMAIISQNDKLVPADKKLYALRDVTATVDSIPMISASIMSKKLATGSDAILLDVKVGNGAFMKDINMATELANTMIGIGKKLKRDVRAEITNMDRPLGKAIGNKNEILEAIDTLNGKGPKDFTEIVYSAAAEILVMSKKYKTTALARKAITSAISSEKAIDIFYK